MPMRARSLSSGDSEAISRSIISASVSFSFIIACSLLRSRGASCARGLCRFSLRREERDGAPGRAADPYVHAFLRRRGASRRPVAAFSFGVGPCIAEAVVFALRFAVSDESPANVPHPVATLLAAAAGRSPDAARVRRLLAAARSPVRLTRAGATGSRLSWEPTNIGM